MGNGHMYEGQKIRTPQYRDCPVLNVDKFYAFSMDEINQVKLTSDTFQSIFLVVLLRVPFGKHPCSVYGFYYLLLVDNGKTSLDYNKVINCLDYSKV